jgi:DNA-binding CsgD family transcriptional regulator/pimeloyl-ACP methyl ester carboxylesterase
LTDGPGHPQAGNSDWLADQLYLTAVNPSRFGQLIEDWNSHLSEVSEDFDSHGALGQTELRGHVARAQDLVRLLTGQSDPSMAEIAVERAGMAAFVVSPSGEVLTCNGGAAAGFRLRPGAVLADMPLSPESREHLVAALALAREAGTDHREILRLTSDIPSQTLFAILRPLPDETGRPNVLVVTTLHVWTAAVEKAMRLAFAVTPAEITVLRQIMSGKSAAEIALALSRSEATIRSQIHSVLSKTGTRSRAELVSMMLTFQTSAVDLGQARPDSGPQPLQRANPYQTLKLPDGRRLDYLVLGHPKGQPFLWLHGNLSQCRLPAEAEDWLHRSCLSMVVPIRAGYGYSSPMPRAADVHRVALDDIEQLRRQLALGPAPVVSLGNDFMLAGKLALALGYDCTHVFGIGATFPIETPEDFARLGRWARFFRANAHHAPWAVSFLARSAYRFGRAVGLERYVETVTRGTVDGAAFADPQVRAAVLAGMEILWGDDVHAHDAFAADMIAVQRGPWPDLARLAVPVTLIHGRKDPNCALHDAEVHQARHPSWRLIAVPEAGSFVHHSHWKTVLAPIAGAMGRPPPGP